MITIYRQRFSATRQSKTRALENIAHRVKARRKTLWLLAALLLPTFVFADTPYQSINNIRQQIQQFIDTYDFGSTYPVTSTVGKIDTRLRLRRCGQPLTISFVNDQFKPGRTFLSVSCQTAKPWNIYVTASIDMFVNILITNKPLLRNQTLSSDDIDFETRRLSTLRSGYFTQVKQLKGMQVTRTIGHGQVVTPALLKHPYLVNRGQQVTLLATVAGIQVRMKGKALANATANSPVRVKNASSGRIVEGIVTGKGVVKIPM